MTRKEKEEYVKYRLESAFNTLDAARVLYENGFYNSAINRLYYSAYYAVNALLTYHDIKTNTHAGAKNQFSLHFIKTKILDLRFGTLFGELFDSRQKGDYGNFFDFDEEMVDRLFDPVAEMIEKIKKLIIEDKNSEIK